MKQIWFKKTKFSYLPVHFMGIMISLAAMVFLVPVFLAIIRNGHSVTDDLYQMFVYTCCTAFCWKWIAEETSN